MSRSIFSSSGLRGPRRRRGGRAARLRPRLHLPALQSQPRRHEDAARHERGRARATRPTSASASTATATAAAWSTTRATRSSPTRSASCWRATSRRCTPTRVFVADVKSTGLFMTDPVLQANGARDALLEDRPLLHEALHLRAEGAGGLREVRPLLLPAAARHAATTTASWRRSPCATCSSAAPASRSPTSRTRCPRPGARPPCRRTAPTR